MSRGLQQCAGRTYSTIGDQGRQPGRYVSTLREHSFSKTGRRSGPQAIRSWLTIFDLTGTATPRADTDVGTVLGLTSTQNVFLDNLTISAPLAPTETLGNETLGNAADGLDLGSQPG
ncbi:hypothetical protein [Mycobacterium paraterrae]|uniref:Uncharacterized protein n=1 Tax=Mycobacterium paraterrae TaxID=577492 RepID=A0ABY3VGI8_9MYCO|nr:hypothetical protein [Mycobacterium paraterrae]UMB68466.1 hypothetical protein MKK62_18875 [Mycobacterium paraterrae]